MPAVTRSPHRAWSADLLIGAALCVVSGAYLAVTVPWTRPPFEDAAMLLRYAEHVAAGHGMVWNIGDPPLDGATDLLFTLAVAAASHLGMSVNTAARLLGVAAHLLTVFLVFIVPRRLYGAPVILCALSALYLALGPAKAYIGAEFGTTFFAACAAIAWAVALMAAETGSSAAEWGVPVLAVMLGMARPDGAILGVLFIVAVAIYRGGADGRRFFIRATATFGVLGGIYFLSRWRYFGHPLPNPFYIKGGGHIFFDSLGMSLGNLVRLVGPFSPLLALGLYSRETARRLMLIAVPVGIFICAWVLLSNEMNFNMRFQYAVLPIVLMSWPGVVVPLQAHWNDLWHPMNTRLRAAVVLAVALTSILVGIRQHSRSSTGLPADSLRDIGERLAAFQSRHYTLVVSEAGLLPLYSGWRAIDAWGLNDAEIARAGRVTPEYLDRMQPAVISFHAYFSPAWPPGPPEGRWDEMTRVLYDYANARGYRLAASFGWTPYETHFFYVRRDLPDAESLIDTIRSTPVLFSGKPAINFLGPTYP